MAASITFKSAEHQARLITVAKDLGKVYGGKLDPEYGAALYILTADRGTWNKAKEYVTRHGIDFDTMLQEMDFSGGYSVLILLAANLFNETQNINPVEFMRLDEGNFDLAIKALQLRRYGLRVN